MQNRLTFRTSAVPTVLLLGLLLTAAPQPASAQSNKSAAASSTEVIMGQSASSNGGTLTQTNNLLTLTYYNSYVTDLDLSVHLVCGLHTESLGQYSTYGDAALNVWIEIDGVPVPVTQDSNGNSKDSQPVGQVTFCDRLDYNLNVFDLLAGTKTDQANAFQWIRRQLPAGNHTIVVKGQMYSETQQGNSAVASVGRRMLVVEPVHASGNMSQ